jgi:hypothetical protein
MSGLPRRFEFFCRRGGKLCEAFFVLWVFDKPTAPADVGDLLFV